MKVVSVSQMQAIEREANANGLSYSEMMENAGRGLAELILDEYGYLEEQGALGLVGSGNNGGDTLVALACLAAEGWKTCAAILRRRPPDDPLAARLLEAGGVMCDLSTSDDYSNLGRLIDEHALLLDGVLGTGFRLPLDGPLAKWLDFSRRWILESKSPPVVIAVDCPSGMDCDSGESAKECLSAERTVTMAAVKQGLLKFPAYRLVGDLDVVEIGLPQGGEGLEAWRKVQTFIPDAEWVRNILPARPPDAHKGTFGTAMIAAGSLSYTGAALLSGEAAYRSGAGLVTLAVPEVLHPALAGQLPEATWLLLPQSAGVISEEAGELLTQNLEKVTALLVGPGLGLAETTAGFIGRLLDRRLPALVVDADGLKLLARQPDWPGRIPSETVLTPHPGEMSVLTGLPVHEIQADRLAAALNFSREWGHIVVLKGAFSIIAAPNGTAAVIPVASSALARAGTGDVLAGLIVGLRAQGVAAFPAAVAAAWIHAAGGLRAAAALGSTRAVLAGDVLRYAIQEIGELS